MIKSNKIHNKPITTFAEMFLAAQGIDFHLDEFHKAYLDIKQKGHDTEMYDSLRYIFGTTLLDVIVVEFNDFRLKRNKSYHHKNKIYNERKRTKNS